MEEINNSDYKLDGGFLKEIVFEMLEKHSAKDFGKVNLPVSVQVIGIIKSTGAWNSYILSDGEFLTSMCVFMSKKAKPESFSVLKIRKISKLPLYMRSDNDYYYKLAEIEFETVISGEEIGFSIYQDLKDLNMKELLKRKEEIGLIDLEKAFESPKPVEILTMSVVEQKLQCSRLPSTNGVVHLPLPLGNYQVGFTDIATPATKDDKVPLLLRLYYPAVGSTQDTSRWPPWYPHPNYAQAYLRYKFPRLGYFQPLLGSFFSWVTGSPRVPVVERSTPLQVPGHRWPVVVFSHGLAACRSTYSFLCSSLAARGYCVAAVEHGDGSACVRTLVDEQGAEPTFLWQELVQPGTPEYQLRNGQVKQRAQEMGMALDFLHNVQEGKFEDTGAWTLDSSQGQSGEMDWEKLENCLDLQNVSVAGHSFGGATTVLTLATDKRFKCGVALDSWMFPLREEGDLKCEKENLLFINCETFQSTNNLKVMKRFEVELGQDTVPSSNVLAVLGASHHSPTDVPTIFKGAGWLSSTLLQGGGGGEESDGLDPYTTLLLNLELTDNWLKKCSRDASNKFASTVTLNNKYMAVGISN